MPSLTITKVSGVIFIASGSQNPKAYFGATGRYQASDDNTTIQIRISTIGQTEADIYNVAYGDLTVGTSTAPSMSSAKVLLNAIFGS